MPATVSNRSASATPGKVKFGIWSPRRVTGGAIAAPFWGWVRSGQADEVDDEDEGLVRLDHSPGAPAAVAQAGRDDEAAAAADLHPGDTLVPPADHLTAAQLEAEGVATVPGGVELLAGAPGVAGVVHLDGVAGLGLLTLADLDVLDHQFRRGRLAGRHVDMGLLAHGPGP